MILYLGGRSHSFLSAPLYHFLHQNGPPHASTPIVDPLTKSGTVVGKVDFRTY